jgi:two-component system, NarL family, response regulator DesR
MTTAESPCQPDTCVARTPVEVALACHQNLVRGALHALIDETQDLKVVAEIADGSHVRQTVERFRPAVLLLDMSMVDFGPTFMADIQKRSGCTRVLTLAPSAKVTEYRAAVLAGASGFVALDTSTGSLLNALRSVSRGEPAFDTDMMVRAMRMPPCPLSVREKSVLSLIAGGLSIAEVAKELCLSNGTVRNYVSNLLMKTAARNRVDLVRLAFENGWI